MRKVKYSIHEDYPDVIPYISDNVSKKELKRKRASLTDKILFKCDKGHEYERRIARIVENVGCGACRGDLYISGVSDYVTKYPKIKNFTHEPIINNIYAKRPAVNELLPIIGRCGHNWTGNIRSLLREVENKKSNACPYCFRGKLLIGFNNFSTKNPIKVSSWSKRNYEKPSEVYYNSRKKKFWVCQNGHEYELTPHERSKNISCYYCSGRKCLSGFSDLATTNPELLAIWNFEKNTVSPKKISAGLKRKIWLHCYECNESYEIIAYNAKAGRRHNKCKASRALLTYHNNLKNNSKRKPTARRSALEGEIYENFAKQHPNLIMEANTFKVITPYELDIYIPELNIGIEVNGEYWHSEEIFPDMIRIHKNKKSKCEELGIKLVIIWEKDWHDDSCSIIKDIDKIIKENRATPKKLTYSARRELNKICSLGFSTC